MRRALGDSAQTLDGYTRRLLNPNAQIRQQRLKLLALSTAMMHANRAPLTRARHQLDRLGERMAACTPDTRAARSALGALRHRAAIGMARTVQQRRAALAALASQLELLNPQRTLERGYAIVTDEAGAVVRAPGQIVAGRTLGVRLAEGAVVVDVAAVR